MSKEFQENQQPAGEGSVDDEMAAIEAMRKKPAGARVSRPAEQDAKAPEPTQEAPPPEPPKPEKPPEKYYRVRFHLKAKPEDADDVILSVQGDVLQIQRNVETILPERFLDAARHAKYPHFRQMPNEPRKVVGEVHTHPFDLLGEAEPEEYFKMRAEGTEQRKKDIEAGNLQT